MKLHSAIFISNDINKLKDFYEDFLQLSAEGKDEDRFIYYVFPNGVKLGIKKAREEREIPGKQTIFVSVDNLEEWYKKVLDKHINIYKPLEVRPWGKQFEILDPDGNKVLFLQE